MMNQSQKVLLCKMVMEALRTGDLIITVDGKDVVDGYGFNMHDGYDSAIKFNVNQDKKLDT